jgi:hypothetical protein
MNFGRIRTLAGKELHRLALNRGAIVMAFLLAAAALLVSTIGSARSHPLGSSAVQTCWIDYWEDGPWLDYLRRHVPPELLERVRFRSVGDIPADRSGTLQYAKTDGAIQLRREGDRWIVWFWYPGDDPAVLRPFEDWFWAESRRYFHAQALAAAPPERRAEVERLVPPPITGDPATLWRELHREYRERLLAIMPNTAAIPEIGIERSSLHAVELPKALGVALVLFAIFFVCVCLMPSLTCEEREKGVLLAQCLTPATASEMLFAKAIVFVPLAGLLSYALGVLIQPAVWQDPFFLCVVFVAALGSFGLGSLIALLVSTQRAASLAAMGYAMAIALIVFVAQRFGQTGLCSAFLEYHLPPLVVTALDGTATSIRWQALGIPAGFSFIWFAAALLVSTTRGWRPV